MSRLTRDGTTEPVSRDQILRREKGQGNIIFHCPADHEQDWQPCPAVDPYPAICDGHRCILSWSAASISSSESECGLSALVSALITLVSFSIVSFQQASLSTTN